jgi:superfamily II DNA or RNA helicase
MTTVQGTEEAAAKTVQQPGGSRPLRAWQRRAITKYLTRKPQDFLAVATPGAGKTVFGLRVAAELLADRVVERVTIVTPTEHLKYQWAGAAAAAGIAIDPNFRNSAGATASDYLGVAVTYAQVAAHPMLHRVRTEQRKTLVILDEIHHGGDAKSWGDGIREAFTPAVRRLSLTGTPFRSDDSPIPFVQYEPDSGGFMRSKADHTYGYSDALADGVVRPVIFLAYSGEASWRTSAGEEFTARLGEPMTNEQTARAWRTALDPDGEWVPAVLHAADLRLAQLRQSVPDAGGLVIASDHVSAKAYAKILTEQTGRPPVVVLSDDPKASSRIAEFSESDDRWLVAVRMVSEGVDVPRLAVGVYATSASTPLFFAQAVGRFVRARRQGETASVFLPSVPVLLELASQLEAQRDHILGKPHREKDGWDDELLADANRQKDEPGEEEKAFTALSASAELDQVIYDGSSFGTAAFAGTEEEQEYLGLPGLLEPDQVRALLPSRRRKPGPRSRRRCGRSRWPSG